MNRDIFQYFGLPNIFGGELMTKFKEDDDTATIIVEAPGAVQDNIDVSYKDDIVSISVTYKDAIFREGEYRTSYGIRNIEGDGIVAKLESGILTITLPKKEEAKPKKIIIT